MSDQTFDSINNLGQQYMIGGGNETFIFNCTNEAGAIVNLTGATCSIKLCPLGQPSVISLSKAGTITSAVNGTWQVVFTVADTSGLYGVYQMQPTIIAADSTTFRPGNLLLNISSLIA